MCGFDIEVSQKVEEQKSISNYCGVDMKFWRREC